MGILHLTRARLAAQLLYGFDQQENPVHAGVAARQAATIGIHRQHTTRRDAATAHECTTFPLGTKPQVFQEQQGIDRECVIQLDHIDIRRAQASHGKSARPRLGGGGDGQVGHGTDLPMPVRHRGTQYIHRRLGKVARAFAAHEDQGTATVGDQTAVEHRQRIIHHARRHDLLKRQLITRISQRVKLRPASRGDSHFSQVFAARAVLMHVPRGSQRIAGDRMARIIGRFIGLRFRHRFQLAETRTLVTPVTDQRDFTQACLQGHSGGQQMANKG